MPKQQLIYASRPFGYSEQILSSILVTARQHNPLRDITGALICRSDIYLQLLEGPVGAVEDLYEQICRDDRHVEIQLLVRARIEEPLFPDWAMRHDPMPSWLWTAQELREGALERATARQVREVFVRVATEAAL